MDKDRAVTIVALAIGVILAAFGVWAFASPGSFYERMAAFPEFNPHFIRDIGSFQFGLGIVLLVSLVRNDAKLVALCGTSAAMVLHFFSHVIDRDLGGRPTDPLSLGVLMIVVVLATVWRARQVGRSAPRSGDVPGVPPSDTPGTDV